MVKNHLERNPLPLLEQQGNFIIEQQGNFIIDHFFLQG